MIDKKEKEKFYLKFVLDSLQMEFKELDSHKDDPDFKIIINNKKIGIELTKIFNTTGDPPLQAIENDYRKIANFIAKMLNKSKLKNLDVLLSFSQNPLPRNKSKKEIGTKIFNFICKNIPDDNSHISVTNDFENDDLLPFELSAIRIAYFVGYNKHLVHTSMFGFVNKDFLEIIQYAIDKKSDKLSIYDKTCDEFWLLIYSDGSSGASMFDASEKTLKHLYYSKFHRVFFLSSINFKVDELCLLK